MVKDVLDVAFNSEGQGLSAIVPSHRNHSEPSGFRAQAPMTMRRASLPPLREASIAGGHAAPPPIMHKVWQSRLRPDGKNAYHITGRHSRYWATNSAQCFQISFYPRHIAIESLENASNAWQVKLLGCGYGHSFSPLPASIVHHSENRIEYDYGDLIEWYVNNASGLEQGFTLKARPEQSGAQQPLTLTLAFWGAIVADPDGQALSLVDTVGQAVLRYGQLQAVDATGRTLPVRLKVLMTHTPGQVYAQIVVDDRQATYPLIIDPIVQQAQIKVTDPVTIGTSLAVSGDTVLIGSPDGTGTVYVFVRNGMTWTQQAKLTTTDVISGDSFSAAVALDGNTALVGAPSKNGYQGAVYVFIRAGTTWSQQAKLTVINPTSFDSFGQVMAIEGDTALFGTDGRNSSRGAAFVFTRNGITWSQQLEFTAMDVAPNDNFGSSAALNRDTAVVGASYKGGGVGAAYVFVRSNSWLQQAKLTAADTATVHSFGSSVALSGDTVLVGANTTNTVSGIGAGSAYVFIRNGTIWSQQAILNASDAAPTSFFGYAVALIGDTALISDLPNTGAGSAYVFTRNSGIWTQQPKLTPAGATNRFGLAVALSANTAVVTDSNFGGTAYIFLTNSDATIIANRVGPANASTGIAYGVAGGFINAGQVVFADASASGQIKLAQTISQSSAEAVGVALNTAAPGQPIAYAISGIITVSPNLTSTTTYMLSSSNAGGLAPDTTVTSGSYGTVIGIATSPTNLRMGLIFTDTKK